MDDSKCEKCHKAIKEKKWSKGTLSFCSEECLETYEKDPKVCEFC